MLTLALAIATEVFLLISPAIIPNAVLLPVLSR